MPRFRFHLFSQIFLRFSPHPRPNAHQRGRQIKAVPAQVDTTAYNCVLDVCIKCGDKKSVADLFTKMKVMGYVDTISYNTLLKGMGAGATGPSSQHRLCSKDN